MKKSPVHSMNFFNQLLRISLGIIIPLSIIAIFSGCDYFFPPLNGDKITVEDAAKFINKHKGDPELILLDIRSKNEYDSIKIENSINLDYTMPDFPEMTEKLDKNKRFILIDKNGKRSPLAFELMREQKFGKVHYITGGIEEWIKLNNPVVKK